MRFDDWKKIMLFMCFRSVFVGGEIDVSIICSLTRGY